MPTPTQPTKRDKLNMLLSLRARNPSLASDQALLLLVANDCRQSLDSIQDYVKQLKNKDVELELKRLSEEVAGELRETLASLEREYQRIKSSQGSNEIPAPNNDKKAPVEPSRAKSISPKKRPHPASAQVLDRAQKEESPFKFMASDVETTDLESVVGGELGLKIVDHRAGPAFLKVPAKDSTYTKFIKTPMSLETVKARIKNKTITTTAEFHRDVMHVLANSVMFHPEDSDINALAKDMMEFVDEEFNQFLATNG
ncbi:hypothetical protein HDV03_001171 [Kappamyces sp. JEL0829]|nr:hypothetical protein HDV03_001171 [Kappamyces sp. JEL0829]